MSRFRIPPIIPVAVLDLSPMGGNYSHGKAINRSGQVVGWADTKIGAGDSFLWEWQVDDRPGCAGCVRDQRFRTDVRHVRAQSRLPRLPGRQRHDHRSARPRQFTPGNCGGQHDKQQWPDRQPLRRRQQLRARRAVAEQDGFRPGHVGGGQASATAINGLGQVAGGAQSSTDADQRYSPIPAGPPSGSSTPSVNDHGQIVADAYDTVPRQTQALLLTPG